MKKHASGSKTMVMLALLAVLLGSLGYLSMQGGGREGLINKATSKNKTSPSSSCRDPTCISPGVTLTAADKAQIAAQASNFKKR